MGLRTRISVLNKKIISAGKEEEYLSMAQEIAEGKITFTPLEEEQWSVMLPSEQDSHFLQYYHSLRIELQELAGEVKKAGKLDQATVWLESPWIKRPLAASGIVALAWKVFEQIHSMGLFAKEEDDDEEKS